MAGLTRVGDTLPTLVDAVQDYIRDRIVSGEYPPGYRLVERELAEATGASRVPVREAIRGLASEKFVTLVPRKGAVVTPLVPEDLDEIFEVREALEVQECVLAAKKAGPDDVARMRVVLDEAARALKAGETEAVNQANAKFHELLVEMSHNTVLSEVLRPLKNRLEWIFRQNHNQRTICEEHEEIAQAIAEGDIEAARDLARIHVATSKKLILDALFGL
ncbi:MAG: GntR family transcriptional regulator [Actinomycetaceae bacterium]|nr:GntR family transcriptional regulator [Actinomycetaceae bacterium]